MTKKKINPNRIPIGENSFNLEEIIKTASDKMFLQAWALVLGALADFSDMTTDALLQLWDSVNSFSANMRTHEDIAAEIQNIERLIGIQIPFERIPTSKIKTLGDLKRFTYKAELNALYSSLGLIACPIIHDKLLSDELFIRVFRKALSLNEEIYLGKKGRVTLEDLLEMLKDEYSVVLSDDDGHVTLSRLIDPSASIIETS